MSPAVPRWSLLLVASCLPGLPSCNGSSCGDMGESLRLTKAEVYASVSAEAGAPDAGAPADDAGSPCPTSQQISEYVAIRYQEWIAPAQIGTPRDDGAACEYPISDTVCE